MLNLGFHGGGGDSTKLFKEVFSQQKLGHFRGVSGYGPGETKPLGTSVNYEIWIYFTSQKNPKMSFIFFSYSKISSSKFSRLDFLLPMTLAICWRL